MSNPENFIEWLRIEQLRTDCRIAVLVADRDRAESPLLAGALTAEIDQMRARNNDRAAVLGGAERTKEQ